MNHLNWLKNDLKLYSNIYARGQWVKNQFTQRKASQDIAIVLYIRVNIGMFCLSKPWKEIPYQEYFIDVDYMHQFSLLDCSGAGGKQQHETPTGAWGIALLDLTLWGHKWHRESWSILFWACYPGYQNQYLDLSWLIVNKILWDIFQYVFSGNSFDDNHKTYFRFMSLRLQIFFLRTNEFKIFTWHHIKEPADRFFDHINYLV